MEINKAIGPLIFEETSEESTQTPCILCEDKFNLNVGFKLFVAHLFDVHHIVIEDVQNIPYFNEYITYWRDRLSTSEWCSIIPSIKVTPGNDYYLISTLLKDDKELRHKLQLKYALKIQEIERTDTNYLKPCLFCSLTFEGTRHGFLNHLSNQHNLQLGNPQNLVFIEELIERIETEIDALRCIYCSKTFPERAVLKEHMRKKLHKRINPNDRNYDKYYVINYLEIDKDWHELERENDRYAVNLDDEYSDWTEEVDRITCLLCDTKETTVDGLREHMIESHRFDLDTIKDFEYYRKVKFVNYVRRKVHDTSCPFCDRQFGRRPELGRHLGRCELKIPDGSLFDQPEYYFPTYENDALLYLLDDNAVE